MKREKKATRPTQDRLNGQRLAIAEPTSDEVTDATIVGEATSVLWKRAKKSDDRLLIGAAHVLHSVWIMLCARGRRAEETMATLEKLCVAYRAAHVDESLDGMPEPIDPDRLKQVVLRDLADVGELPPKEGLDRHLNVGTLYRLTDHLWRIPVDHKSNMTVTPLSTIAEKDIGRAASMFVYLVKMLIPNIVRMDKSGIDMVTKKVAVAWDRRARLSREPGKKVDTELLVVDGLVAIGVPRVKVHNWMKGAVRVAAAEGTSSGERGQGRDAQGRFGFNRKASKE